MQLKPLQGLEKEKLAKRIQGVDASPTSMEPPPSEVEDPVACEIRAHRHPAEGTGDDRATDIPGRGGRHSISHISSRRVSVFTLTAGGYIKSRTAASTYKAAPGCKGITAHVHQGGRMDVQMRPPPPPTISFFHQQRAEPLQERVINIPRRAAPPGNLVNVLPIEQDEKVTAMITAGIPRYW